MTGHQPPQDRTRRPRQADIARLSGVSVSTVSRVLAGEAGISTSVQSQIFRAATDLGYPLRRVPMTVPNLGLARLSVEALLPAERATGDIGAFYQGILEALQEAAETHGFTLTTRLFSQSRVGPADLRETADASFLIGLDIAETASDAVAASGKPVVLVNGSDPAMRFDCVAPDNFYGGRLATHTLLDLGHRHIAYVAGQHRPTTRERARGFRQAIAEAGDARGTEAMLAMQGRTFEEAGEAIARLLDETPGITAAFCMNDAIALGVLAAVEGRGLRIPEDFSVLGFDDLPCATMIMPRLATVRVDRRGLGREAVSLLARRFSDPMGVARHVQLAVTLVEGGTVSAAGSRRA